MRRARKILLWLLAILLVPVVLITGGLLWFVYVAGEDSWSYALRQATDSANTPDMQIDFEGFRREPGGVIVLDRLNLSDREGVWLTVDEARVDFHPSHLLHSRTAWLEAVTARRIEVVRAPVSEPVVEPEPEPEGFKVLEELYLPQLPVAIRLEHLQVDEIVLAQGLAPETTRLKVDGRVSAIAEEFAIDLRVEPLDLGDSRIVARAGVNPATGLLETEIDIRLPVIEPLREPLGAPEGARINVNVTGGGPLNESRLQYGASIDGVVDLVGDLYLAADPDTGVLVRADGFANLTGGVMLEPAGIIGPAVEFRTTIRLPDPQTVKVESAEITGQYLTVSAVADLDLTNETAEAKLDAQFRHHDGLDSLLQGASFETVSVTAEANGPFDELTADLDLLLRRPTYPGYSANALRLLTKLRTDGAGIEGPVTITANGIVADDPGIAGLIGDRVVLRSSLVAGEEQIQLRRLQADLAAASAQGELTLTTKTSAIDGELRITAQDLGNIAQLSGVLTGGSGNIQIALTGLSADSGTASVQASLSGLTWRDPSLRSIAGERVTLQTDASLSGGDIRMSSRVEAAGGLNGTVNAGLTGDQVSGDYAIALPDLPGGLVPPELAGLKNLALTGTVSGTIEKPATELRLTAGDLTVNDISIAEPVIRVTASDLLTGPRASIRVNANVMKEPLALTTAVAVSADGSDIRIGDTLLTWQTARVSVDGGFDATAPLAGTEAQLRIDDLTPFGQIAGTPLSGRLEGTLRSVSERGQLGAVISLRATDLAADQATIRDLTADLTLDDLEADAPSLAGEVKARTIAAGSALIEAITIGLSGNLRRPVADLRVVASAPAAATLNTTVSVDLNDPEAIVARFASLALEAEEGSITARSPLLLTMRGETVDLTGLDLTSSVGGTVSGQMRYAPTRLAADLRIEQLPVGPLAAIAGLEGFGGEVNATVRADTAEPSDKADVTVRVTNLAVPDVTTDVPFAISLDVAWRGGQALADARIEGPFERPLTAKITGEMPASGALALPEPPPGGTVSGTVSWQGDLASLLALAPESDHLAGGPAAIDIRLGGTWSEPTMAGAITVSDARYENLLTGTHLRDLGMDVRFDDSGNGRFQLKATGPEGGTVSGDGEVVLVGTNRHAEIVIAMRNLLALRRDEARAILSGDTRVTWDGQRLDVRVRKTLDRVDIYLAAPDLPPSVVNIELERDRDRREEEEAAREPGMPIGLDIEIASEGQFFVRGRGLESEWRGTLNVKGTAEEPIVRSRFQAIRGTLALLGRDFTLDKGELGLDESFEPDFRIELVRETPDLTGRIIVSGNPAKPDIAFTSEPELPQDEVLPRILFDKAKQSLSPLEAINLAQGIRTLTNGKPDATSRIRESVGLDVLRFEEGDTEDSAGAVSVGRYVSDNIYVGAKKSVDSEAGSVVVEIDLLPNLKVDAEVGQDGGTSTGITWEKKY